jgi:hypothetical protein
MRDEIDTLRCKLRNSRHQLERELAEGHASCDAQSVLDKLAELRSREQAPDRSDSLPSERSKF